MPFIVHFFFLAPFLHPLAPPKAPHLAVAWELEYMAGAGYGRHHRAGLAKRGQRYDAAMAGTGRGSGVDRLLEPRACFQDGRQVDGRE